ncbi:hypothetical protein AWB91_11365 [Mycobacterium paraense]|uniref:Uncharacterized protein n=1 Tax=Mycobacterium paraense TaxID=767916 RepID=A0ABX3VQK8_9MYCO|nr:hypothetical protein AWB91_11365 [Mycobacterium paraense]
MIQRERYQSGDVRDAGITDEIADTAMKMQTQLLSDGVLVSRETVDVAAEAQQGEQFVARLTGEHTPGHFDVAVEH